MIDVEKQNMTVWRNQLPAWRLPQRQLVQQLNNMRHIATVAKAGMDELSSNYEYSVYKMHTALAIAAQMREKIAAGNIPPEEEAAYQRDEEAFQKRMLEIAEVASCQILEEQQRAPEALKTRGLIDGLSSLLLGG